MAADESEEGQLAFFAKARFARVYQAKGMGEAKCKWRGVTFT